MFILERREESQNSVDRHNVPLILSELVRYLYNSYHIYRNPAIVGRSDDDSVIILKSIVKIESTTRLSSVFLP